MSFGENVGYYRKQLKITQEELAERLGVSRQTVSRWETDSTFPDVETVIKLCEIFECDMDTLVRKSIQKATPSSSNDSKDTSADLIAYDKHMTLFAHMIALGVGFILFGVSLMMVISVFSKNEVAGVIFLLSCIALSVTDFIIIGIRHENFMKDHSHMCPYPEERKRRFQKRMPILIAVATLLIFIGIIFLIVTCSDEHHVPQIFTVEQWQCLSVSIFLFLLAVSVYIYIHTGISDAKYDVTKYNKDCIKEGVAESENQSNKRSKISETISSVIMMLATVIFLLCGFLGNLWHPAWIVFPVGGICCGIVSVIVEAVLKNNK